MGTAWKEGRYSMAENKLIDLSNKFKIIKSLIRKWWMNKKRAPEERKKEAVKVIDEIDGCIEAGTVEPDDLTRRLEAI